LDNFHNNSSSEIPEISAIQLIGIYTPASKEHKRKTLNLFNSSNMIVQHEKMWVFHFMLVKLFCR